MLCFCFLDDADCPMSVDDIGYPGYSLSARRLGRSLFDLTVRRTERGRGASEGEREVYIPFANTKYLVDIFSTKPLQPPPPLPPVHSPSLVSVSLSFPRTQTHISLARPLPLLSGSGWRFETKFRYVFQAIGNDFLWLITLTLEQQQNNIFTCLTRASLMAVYRSRLRLCSRTPLCSCCPKKLA